MFPLGLSREEFERAFAEFLLWGPRKRIPIEQRLQEALPVIDSASIPKLLETCRAIEEFAETVARDVIRGAISDEAALQQIAHAYPYLNSAQLRRIYSQACFYAMH